LPLAVLRYSFYKSGTMKENSVSGLFHPPNPGTRFYAGLGIFVLSFFMLPTGLFLQKFATFHTTKHLIIGIFWLLAPLMKISSVAILGKPSYLYIKSIFRHHVVRVIKPYHDSRIRYNIGLLLFFFPIIPTYIMAYAPQFFSDKFLLRLILNISVDVIFIASLFILGGDFWDKLKALFIFSAKANFPEEEKK
jgi:hypothetical protein